MILFYNLLLTCQKNIVYLEVNKRWDDFEDNFERMITSKKYEMLDGKRNAIYV